MLKRIFCKHTYGFVRKLYGDDINAFGGKRSIWKCTKCGKIELSSHLGKLEDGLEYDRTHETIKSYSLTDFRRINMTSEQMTLLSLAKIVSSGDLKDSSKVACMKAILETYHSSLKMKVDGHGND